MTFWKPGKKKKQFKLTENDFKPWSLPGETKNFFLELKEKNIIYQVRTIIRILVWIAVFGLSLYESIKSLLSGG